MRRWYQNLGGRVESLMTPRALILRAADTLADPTRDTIVLRAIGLTLTGSLILAWAGRRLTGA